MKSSSPPNENTSSQSSVPEPRALGKLVDIMPGFAIRCECIIRWPKPSSPDPGGDEPMSRPLVRDSLPYAELCRFLTASVGRAVLTGNEFEGDSRPNLEGTDAATAPCLAIYEIPWLSKDAGIGASRTLRCATGDIGFRLTSRGDPYLDSGCDR